MLRLVPFNASWVNHDKMDLKAIYKRPRFVEDAYGEKQREYDKDGLATWDLTGPLPVRRHNDWAKKGFEYVTLADRASLVTAARFGTVLAPGAETSALEPTTDWKAVYDQHQTGGPWNYKKYQEGEISIVKREADQLKLDVEEFGSRAVESIRQRTEPGFTLPPHLQGIPPGGAAAVPGVVSAATAAKAVPGKGKDAVAVAP